MDELGRLRDAARLARRAAHPTDIVLIGTGFQIVARNGGVRAARRVSFDDFELSDCNPLVEAIRNVNRDLVGSPTDFREG